jgi:S-adenosylmethionine hydrolase
MRIVSLVTDFGLADTFVAEMKAVVLSICPEARIVDITHQVDKFDVRMGSFLLASAAPRFPAGTVHVAVVDPGVGSERRPILVEGQRSLFVGPDNGLLIPAAQSEGILRVYELTNRALMRSMISSTFHGRDIFAPVAAHMVCGTAPKDCGPEISDYVKIDLPEPKIGTGRIVAEVIHVDGFGNIVTNLRSKHMKELNVVFGKRISVMIRRRRISARYVRTYSDLRGGELGVLVGSHGFIEVACREENAAKKLRARSGVVVHVGSA